MGWIIGSIAGGTVGILIYSLFPKKRHNKRFSQFVRYSGDIVNMSAQIDSFLKELHYFSKSYQDEIGVYSNGNYKHIKMIQKEDGFLVEAFATDILGKEMNLKGFINLTSKAPCKKAVKKLISYIQSEHSNRLILHHISSYQF